MLRKKGKQTRVDPKDLMVTEGLKNSENEVKIATRIGGKATSGHCAQETVGS